MRKALAIAMVVLVAAVALTMPAFAKSATHVTQKIDAASMATATAPNDVGTTQITAIQDAKTAIDTGQEGTIVTAKTSEDVKAKANGTSMATNAARGTQMAKIDGHEDAQTAFTTTKSTADTAKKVEGRHAAEARLAVLAIG